MSTVRDIANRLDQLAPTARAESWDNVGLLVGDGDAQVTRVMTCLTITPTTADEAVRAGAELIISHHPMPFVAQRQLVADTTVGRILLKLIRAGVAIASPHTGFDSADEGINERLAAGLGLRDIKPLIPREDGEVGAGRWGRLENATPLAELAERLKTFLSIDRLKTVAGSGQAIETVAIGCGAAGEFIEQVVPAGLDCFITGEARFHDCLEAEARGVALMLTGHFASERFAVECLADVLAADFPELDIWASRCERDPISWL